MKINNLFLVFFVIGLISIACNSTRDAYADESKIESNESGTIYFDSLADYIRRDGKAQVVGSGDNVKVYLRGVSTIKLDTQPLYVIDNMPIGTDYARANSTLNPNNIASVKVLRGPLAVTKYGQQATNGVIVVRSKQYERLNKN